MFEDSVVRWNTQRSSELRRQTRSRPKDHNQDTEMRQTDNIYFCSNDRWSTEKVISSSVSVRHIPLPSQAHINLSLCQTVLTSQPVALAEWLRWLTSIDLATVCCDQIKPMPYTCTCGFESHWEYAGGGGTAIVGLYGEVRLNRVGFDKFPELTGYLFSLFNVYQPGIISTKLRLNRVWYNFIVSTGSQYQLFSNNWVIWHILNCHKLSWPQHCISIN